MHESDYIESLLHDYFVRDLTKEELDALNTALKKDVKLRQKYAHMTRDEVLLHTIHETKLASIKVVPLQKKRRSRRAVTALAASITVLLSIGVAIFLRSQDGAVAVVAEPVAVISDYFVIHGYEISAENGDTVRALRLGAPLYMGDEVYLPKGSRLSFQYFTDETTLEIRSDSRFKLLETDGAKHIQLVQGSLEAEVDQQDPDKPMKVLTDESEMVVLGTEFVFMNDSIERLSVRSGCVQMNERNGEVEQKVFGGYYAERLNQNIHAPRPFEEKLLRADVSRTLNAHALKNPASKKYIVIDPERNLRGVVAFDLGDFSGEIIEATLRVRVVKFYDDEWGEGILRVFQAGANPDLDDLQERLDVPAQMATYTGNVGAGMNLEFKLDPKKMSQHMNHLIIQLDQGGNDFWFSSNQGPFPPELELKFARKTPYETGDQ
jgi:hypothetical protein